eukprot:scaffold10203_cov272-Chaetoceros_neogracile.AAC.48
MGAILCYPFYYDTQKDETIFETTVKKGEEMVEKLICMWHFISVEWTDGSLDTPSYALEKGIITLDSA